MGAAAERYCFEDPNVSLYKLRQFGELLAQMAAESVGVSVSRDANQIALLRDLEARGVTDEANTKAVCGFDLRSNMPQFGKRTQLTLAHFAEFEAAWATDAQGTDLSKRVDMGEMGRWRRFGRKEIADRADSLDISWLRDENEERSEDLPEPAVLAQAAVTELKGAIEELHGILAELAIG